jgi:hypothetical protein
MANEIKYYIAAGHMNSGIAYSIYRVNFLGESGPHKRIEIITREIGVFFSLKHKKIIKTRSRLFDSITEAIKCLWAMIGETSISSEEVDLDDFSFAPFFSEIFESGEQPVYKLETLVKKIGHYENT